ncbi:MAG: ABC transporter ATP-binding protein [Elusimicrobia bacterium]|nr:ABC transporter ATP-binding protein [Candidatus Obscuribacterium magneticum]
MKYAVDVQGLSIKFGDFIAVDDISFSVKTGEIFGFLGANGAGKTTTIRMLCGLLSPASGTAFVSGLRLGEDNIHLIKSKVGYMSQRFTLYEDLTVDENLSFAASLRKLDISRFECRKKELFSFIGFKQQGKVMVRDLPGGIKQQLALVTAILHDPDIIFLDEPTSGVTPAARAKFWNLIRDLAASGKTVFVTTHYMDEAEQCGRIALMRAGKIIALDTPYDLKEKTFPGNLYEIEFLLDVHAEYLDDIRSKDMVDSLYAYGMRYHAVIENDSAWMKYADKMKNVFHTRPIKPSLEDVFVELVEGRER